MVSFIDQHQSEYGVEPICALLPIASSTYRDFPTPEPPQSMTESLSGQSALIAEIVSDGVHDIVLIISVQSFDRLVN